MDMALYHALSGNGQPGAPAIQSQPPVAPPAAPPTAAGGPSLFEALQMAQQPKPGPMLASNDSPFGNMKSAKSSDQIQQDVLNAGKPGASPTPAPKTSNGIMWNS